MTVSLLTSHHVYSHKCLCLLMCTDGSLLSGLQYGNGHRPILLSTLNCSREQNLLDCRRASNYVGYHSCETLNGNTVALRCDGKYVLHYFLR